MARHPAYLELNFCPNAELISVARQFVSDFYDRILRDPDATSRVALATHELLENAVKYSVDGATTLRIEVASNGEGDHISIQTTNRANADHIEVLRGAFEEMQATADAFAFYQRLMHRNARRQDGSGLGLARIRAEGEMTMSCRFDQDQVFIVAQTGIDLREKS